MIDIVGAKARTNELLEEIGLFIRALGGAKPRDGLAAVFIGDARQAGGRDVKRFLPARLAKMRRGVGGIDINALGKPRLANERFHQPLRIGHVVEAKTPLHAETVLI